MSEMIDVLVVDDHLEIRTLLAEYLTKHGMRVKTADGGRAMREKLAQGRFDVIVLDLMMPEEDGLTLCREIRQNSQIPVIMLTAMGEEADRVVGLEMGADDYVTKPFSARELLARIKVVVKRSQSMPFRHQPEMVSQDICFANWRLDSAKQSLHDAQGRMVPLSTAEFRLLNVFINNPKHVLNRDQIMEATKGHAAGVFDRSIDNLISRLRKKIEPDPRNPTILKTVWGGGYMLTEDVKRV